MTDLQRAELRSSELRQQLNDLGQTAGDLSDEQQQEVDKLSAELRSVETKRRALIAAQADEPDPTVEPDGEAAEIRAIRRRVQVADYVEAAMDARAVDGAAGEFNDALDMKRRSFPIELLLDEPTEAELRASTDAESTVVQRPWIDRLFSDTAAMYLGVTFASCAPGIASYPLTTAGATPAQRGRTEDAADGAWTISVTEIEPTGNRARVVFNNVDADRIPGLEQALRRDLRMAMAEKIDRTIFVGDDGANETRADITGLISASDVVEKTLTQANKIKGPETLTAFAELIDGKHASMPSDLKIVAAVGANTLWLGTVINSAADNMTLAEFLRGAGQLSWMTRGDIETATSNGKFGAFIGRQRGIVNAGVACVWREARLIRDVYSEAASDETALTLQYSWGFKLPRPSNFARLKFIT